MTLFTAMYDITAMVSNNDTSNNEFRKELFSLSTLVSALGSFASLEHLPSSTRTFTFLGVDNSN